jgi:hypothetical protein
MARVPTIETTIATDCSNMTMTFEDGRKLTLFVGHLSPDVVAMATMHGLKQKLVDAAAISRNPDTGRSATTEDKYAAVREVYDRLLAGAWNKGRADGTGSGGAGGLLFRALSRHYPKLSPDQIRAFIAGKSKEEQAALRKLPAIAAHIEAIKAESTKTGDVDADALLAGLADMEGGEL